MTTQWRYRLTGPVEFPGTRIAQLDGGMAMFAPARVTFEFDIIDAIVDLVVEVEDGRPCVQEYTVRRTPGGPPVEFVARDAVRGVSLRDLLREVVASRALEPTGEGQWRHVTTAETLAAAVAGVKSRRLPMSDERLRLTADAFKAGGVGAVTRIQGWECETRQAQRAIKLARERGFLPKNAEEAK